MNAMISVGAAGIRVDMGLGLDFVRKLGCS